MSKSDTVKLFAQTMAVMSSITGSYSDFSIPPIKIKPTIGTYNVTRCSICGKSRVTLYKNTDGTMICRDCKLNNKGDENNDRTE